MYVYLCVAIILAIYDYSEVEEVVMSFHALSEYVKWGFSR